VEAFSLFRQMDSEVNKDIVSFLCHSGIAIEDNTNVLREGKEKKTDMSRMKVNKEEIDVAGDDYAANEKDYFDPSDGAATAVRKEPVKVGPKIGRNDPCPCGSGKKFKQCHGKDA
jgi:preprotein translocase subunit SecA